VSDYRKHRGHLIGENEKHDPKCFQCGEVIHESGMFAYPYSGFGNPTNGKPDPTSTVKPPIADYFYKDSKKKGKID